MPGFDLENVYFYDQNKGDYITCRTGNGSVCYLHPTDGESGIQYQIFDELASYQEEPGGGPWI